jgi:hypothetical protein
VSIESNITQASQDVKIPAGVRMPQGLKNKNITHRSLTDLIRILSEVLGADGNVF